MALSLKPDARRSEALPSPRGPAQARLPTLAGPRLQLRWMEPGDLDDLFAVYSDAEVVRYWSHGAWPHRDEATIYLEAIESGYQAGDLFQWGIALREDDRIIGTVTLYGIDHPQARAEVGFALARAHWGRRYGREALTALLDHAFGTLALRRIEADVDPRNLPSCRLAERLGFQREGLLRNRWRVGGEFADSVLYGLLRNEYRRQA